MRLTLKASGLDLPWPLVMGAGVSLTAAGGGLASAPLEPEWEPRLSGILEGESGASVPWDLAAGALAVTKRLPPGAGLGGASRLREVLVGEREAVRCVPAVRGAGFGGWPCCGGLA